MPEIRDSLLRQAAWRLGLVVVATLLVVGGASYAIFQTALQHTAALHAEGTADFYRQRLRQLETHWEQQAIQFKNQLEISRALENPAGLEVGAESFLTMMGEESGFVDVQIDDPDGRLLFNRGIKRYGLSPMTAADAPPHWYHDEQSHVLYRVYSMPIWLGSSRGMGHIHWYVPIDNGLLLSMAALNSALYALWDGKVVASSTGRAAADADLGEDRITIEDNQLTVQRRLPWGTAPADPVLVVRDRLASPMPWRGLGLSMLALVGVLLGAMALVLGLWLLRTGRRMALLTRATRQFGQSISLTPEVGQALAAAGRGVGDEIDQVAGALRELIQSVCDHRSERDVTEATLKDMERRLSEALQLASLAHWEVDLAARRIRMNDQFYRLYRTSAEDEGGYELDIGIYVARFLCPEDSGQVERNLQRALDENDPNKTYQDEARVCCGDGVTRWFNVRFHLVQAEDGAPAMLRGTLQDIDEYKRQELELRRYLDILEAARDIISSASADGRVIYMNAAGRDLLGMAGDETDLGRIADYHSADEAARIRDEALPLCDRQGYWQGESLFMARNGREIPTWQVVVAHRGQDGQVSHYSTIARDLTERKQADAQLRLMATVFENSGEAILITDADNRIVTVNASFTRLTGYGIEAVRGQNPRLLSAGRTSRDEYVAMWTAIREQGFWRGEIWDRRRDGSVYPKWLSITAVPDGDGRIVNYIASFSDITEHKRAEEQIKHLAHHDALTGLPNRFSLQSRLAQAVAAAQRQGQRVAVVFIDLDRFKTINDTLGHHMGDELLMAVADRLQQCVRASDIVARLGGDEFVVALTEVGSSRDAVHLAEKLLQVLAQPYRIEGHELHTTPSIGISLSPDDGTDEDALMKHADIAMYHAKSRGRNNYQFFTAAMNEVALERLALESALHQALDQQEFRLHFQPQVDVRTGRAVGVEALVRWQSPEGELVPPGKFIPILEDTGLIVPVGEWVLMAACRELKRWQSLGIAGVQMAVNLSARQFRQKNLVEVVANALHASGLQPDQLELEITETVAMDNPQETIETLRRLKAMGVMLAIDDFGTGYSSLNYLKLFPINRLKLDRSFVADIETDPNDAAICSATIALAHNLGLDVVAEGVENQAQAEYLKRIDCDLVQGFLYCRPQPGEVIGDWILERNRE